MIGSCSLNASKDAFALKCPGISAAIQDKLVEVAQLWLAQVSLWRAEEAVLDQWDAVLREWVTDDNLPLLIRRKEKDPNDKSKVYPHGRPFSHTQSGRELITVDNAPATWCCAAALRGEVWSAEELHVKLRNHELPVTMMSPAEEATYRGTLVQVEDYNLNNMGWKVSHVIDVGLGTRGSAAKNKLIDLQRHSYNLLRPRNMFLVPKNYAGLGELPEVQKLFKDAQKVADYTS
jgi:hypothetical protein